MRDIRTERSASASHPVDTAEDIDALKEQDKKDRKGQHQCLSTVSKYKKCMRYNTVFSNFLNMEKETHRETDRG